MVLLSKERLEDSIWSERVRAGFDLESAWIAIFLIFLRLLPNYPQWDLIRHVLKHVPTSPVAHGLQHNIPPLVLTFNIVGTGHGRQIRHKRGPRHPCEAVPIPHSLKHLHHQTSTVMIEMRGLNSKQLINRHYHMYVCTINWGICFLERLWSNFYSSQLLMFDTWGCIIIWGHILALI